jgi:hypothetical protein
MGASYSEVFASCEACADDDNMTHWSAQAFHRSGVLVWKVPDDLDEPVVAAWVPYPDDDGPTLLLNMTEEERDRIGLDNVSWASLCAGLLVDEMRQDKNRLGRDGVSNSLDRIERSIEGLRGTVERITSRPITVSLRTTSLSILSYHGLRCGSGGSIVNI